MAIHAMAKKVTELPAASSVTTDDLLAVVDDPAGSPATQKATIAQTLDAGIGSHFALYNTYANLPAAGKAGRIFTVSDGPGRFVDTGSAWRPIIQSYMGASAGALVPAAATWGTTISEAGIGLTLADSYGRLKMTWSNANGATSPRLAKKSAPAAGATGYRVRFHMTFLWPMLNSINGFMLGGAGFRQSSDGRIEALSFAAQQASRRISRHRYTASNTGSSPNFSFDSEAQVTPSPSMNDMWLGFERDTATGNRRFYWSPDNNEWIELTSMSSTANTFLTPDEVFVWAWNSTGATEYQGVIIDSYEETAF